MPLILKSPQSYAIDTVRITALTLDAAKGITVSYQRGCYLGEKFFAVETSTATFDAAAVAGAGADKACVKLEAAAYELLQARVGPGTVK